LNPEVQGLSQISGGKKEKKPYFVGPIRIEVKPPALLSPPQRRKRVYKEKRRSEIVKPASDRRREGKKKQERPPWETNAAFVTLVGKRK